MAVDDLNPADLAELVTALKAAGTPEQIRSVSLDPDKVQLPGIWVRFDGVRENSLAGLTVRTTVFLIVPAAGGISRQLAALAELRNVVAPVIKSYGGPNGDTTRTGVILPSGPAALPSLAVPLDLLTSQEE